MKNPLHYQISDYDCGPTSILNAISFLFEREEIPPEIIRNIMLYCLDCYNAEGIAGKCGTSRMAMMFLSNWVNGFGKIGQLDISSKYISCEQVYMSSSSYINDTLRRGGAVVVRLFYDEWHYVTLTGIENGMVYLFDPYYREEEFEDDNIKLIQDNPFSYNRVVPEEYFNCKEEKMYAFGAIDGREAVLIFNDKTKLTEDNTIEYFI